MHKRSNTYNESKRNGGRRDDRKEGREKTGGRERTGEVTKESKKGGIRETRSNKDIHRLNGCESEEGAMKQEI